MAKKVSNTNSNKLYGAAKKMLKYEIKDVYLPVTENEKVKVALYPNISLADKAAIIEEVITAAFVDGVYNPLYMEAYLSKCVLMYMTNIPVPMVYNDDEEPTDVADLNICHQLVHGMILGKNDEFDAAFNDILFNIGERVDSICTVYEIAAGHESTAINKLAQKLLDLYELIKAEIDDIANNPAAFLDLLESIEKSGNDLKDKNSKSIAPGLNVVQ
ncbi:hypothetical protein AALA22_08840 [Anaerovoracaceae bacterium 41-7]